MQTATAQPYDHTIISSGPDWITATAKLGTPSLAFEELADQELQKKRDAGGAIHQASRFGYQGHSFDGFFFGRRAEDSCIIASGPDTPYRVIPIIEAASNVSRLDLQVSVWTHGEQPHLAMESYNRLVAHRRQAHRPGRLTLITSDPNGETLNVNSRSSDQYGRLYDKASEAKLGPPRTVWRYEVEFKRSAARAYATGIHDAVSVADRTRHYVHSWFTKKGVKPTFNNVSNHGINEVRIDQSSHDVLRWFEESVSVTVARAIRSHGLKATIQALGLEALVTTNQKGDAHGR